MSRLQLVMYCFSSGEKVREYMQAGAEWEQNWLLLEHEGGV